jgi:hypothetical protein
VNEPKDYSARQVIVENVRVDTFMKSIVVIATALVTALLIWMATTLNSLDHQVANLVTWNEIRGNDHNKYESRLHDLERRYRYKREDDEK